MDCFFINEARLPVSRLGPTPGRRERFSVVDALRAVVTVMLRVPSRDASEEIFVESFVQSSPQWILLAELLGDVSGVSPG